MGVSVPTISKEEWEKSVQLTSREWQRVRLPIGWSERSIPRDSPAFGARLAVCGKLAVIFSAGHHAGQLWLHVSVAHPLKIPSYSELADVKRIFVGDDREALQVFPPASEHVNIHPRCLHLWASLEPNGSGLPRFGREGSI